MIEEAGPWWRKSEAIAEKLEGGKVKRIARKKAVTFRMEQGKKIIISLEKNGIFLLFAAFGPISYRKI